MKFRRTVSSVIISALLVLVALVTVLYFGVASYGIEKVRELVVQVLPSGEKGLSIKVGSVDSTIMRSVSIRDISVDADNENVLLVSNVNVSASVWDLVRMLVGKGPKDLGVDLSGVELFISDKTVGAVMATLSSFSTGNSTDGGDGGNSGAGLLDSVGLSVFVKDLVVHLDYAGFRSEIGGIAAAAAMEPGLSFSGADINIPYILVSNDSLGLGDGLINDIRLSVNNLLEVSASVSDFSVGELGRIDDLSAIAALVDGTLSGAMFFSNGRLAFNGMDAVLSNATANVSYGISAKGAVFGSSFGTVAFSAPETDISVSALDLSLAGLLEGKSLSIKGESQSLKGSVSGYSAELSGVSVDTDLALDRRSVLGQLEVSEVLVGGTETMGLSDLRLNGGQVDFSYAPNAMGGRIRGRVGGVGASELLGSFEASLDVGAQMSDSHAVSFASMDLSDVHVAAFIDPARLSLILDSNGNVNGELGIGERLSSRISYDNGAALAEARVFINDLNPSVSGNFYSLLEAIHGFVADNTSFDGNVVVSAEVTNTFSDWYRSSISGDFSAFPDISSAFDLFSVGRISLNSATRDLMIGNTAYNGSISLEANIDRNTADISSFAVSALGMRLAYSGSIDLVDLFPDGSLTLQNASDGKELARFLFSYVEGEKAYDFVLESPLVEDTRLEGSLNWRNGRELHGNMVVFGPAVDENGLAMDVFASLDPMMLDISGDQISLNVEVLETSVDVDGRLDSLEIHTGEDSFVVVDTLLSGFYGLDGSGFGVSLKDLFVQVSDILGIGLDLSISDRSFELGKLSIERKDKNLSFDGGIHLGYTDVAELFSGDIAVLSGTVDLQSSDDSASLMGSITDNQFYLDLRYEEDETDGVQAQISALGVVKGESYVRGVVRWGAGSANRMTMNASYRDGIISLHDTDARMGSLSLDDFDLTVDFSQMIMDGSFSFLNQIKTKEGATKTQSGTITLGGKMDSLGASLFQILAGLDYSIDFSLGLSDVRLADGYRISDTQADIEFSNGVLTFGGNMINGSIDLTTGFVDVGVSRDFLFGFKAKGFVGNEMDLMVNDIWFPLPVANQLLNTPLFKLEEGILEGDVLVMGSLSNPSLYGMAYVQSFALSLFYLPGQVISAKNVPLAFQDHRIILTKTPLSGYNDIDGRYSRGDISMEIILQGLGLDSLDFKVDIDPDSPVSFWFPTRFGNMDFELETDVSGELQFLISGGKTKLEADITPSSAIIDFSLDENVPDWVFGSGGSSSLDLDVRMTTGKDIEFYYPEKDNSFLNFTLREGKTVGLVYSDGRFSTDGGLELKTGQVYYFHNDFVIKSGSVDLSEKKFFSGSGALPFVLNLTAELTDYDSDGNKVVINLILQDSTLDNIEPRFTSTPSMSQNDILAMLGDSIISKDRLESNVSVASLAYLASTATDALSRVGFLESNQSYSIASTIRNALNLDIFSARSNIIRNIIVDALPGEFERNGEVSMLARYLDGTSIYAGKYLGTDLFAKVTLMLKADSSASMSSDVGHFLAKDLILDTEISIDLDNPMGTFTVFTRPHELSVFDILDTIGFSVTKQFQF